MRMTKTRAVAKMVVLAQGRGHMIFNDRLADGTRSLKVWGWTLNEYTEAKKLLELYGCKVTMVQKERYINRLGQRRMVTRLHVTE